MLKAILLILMLVPACGGCRTTIGHQFRVVNAIDGRPIEGVRAEAYYEEYQPSIPLCWPILCKWPSGEAISDQDGLFQFELPVNCLELSGKGYEPCTLTSGLLGIKSRDRRLLGGDRFAWKEGGILKITMQPCE